MNTEAKQLWLDTIRSDQYRQVAGALHGVADNERDVMGCLAQAFIEATGRGEWTSAAGGPMRLQTWAPGMTDFASARRSITKHVIEWAGLSGKIDRLGSVLVTINGKEAPLAQFNDQRTKLGIFDHGLFELADVIEEQL